MTRKTFGTGQEKIYELVISELYKKGYLTGGLLRIMYKNAREELVLHDNAPPIKTFSTEIDNIRIYEFFRKLASALYLHNFGERYVGRMSIAPIFLLNNQLCNETDIQIYKLLTKRYDKEVSLGYNKEIFYYSFSKQIEDPIQGLWLHVCLYEIFYCSMKFNHS
jgi:hypothetical protein